MTSISSFSQSPLSQVQSLLKNDSKISATDQSALSSALQDIGSQLQSGGDAGGAKPGSMKDRIGSMIDNEVSNGKLTSDQASELKDAFEQMHSQMKGPGGPEGSHGHHDGGGVESLLASQTGTDDSDDDKTASTSSTKDSSTTSAASALEAFLKQFNTAVDANSTYGADGTSGGSFSATSLFVDKLA